MSVDYLEGEASLAVARSGDKGARRRRRRRAKSGSPRSRSDRITAVLLTVAVVGSVLAIGTVHVPTLIVVASVVFTVAVLTLRGTSLPAGSVPGPALLFAALGAYTVIQALPMPLSWLTHVEAMTAEIWSRSATAIGEQPERWAALSVDPGASWVEALKWWVYAAVFVVSAGVGAKRGAGWAASLLLVSATIVAVVTMGHGAADATTVFGIYEPRFGGERWHIGPLINPNNLAGYLNLGVLSGLGLLVDEDSPAPRWVIGLSVATVLGASIIAASRGGIVALLVGLTLLAALLGRSHSTKFGRRLSRRLIWPGVVTVVGGLAFALIAATPQTRQGLLQKDITKLQDLTWTVGMMRDHPWFGIGRGAFQSSFQQYLVGPDDIVFSHPENLPVQWLSEWGLPVGGVGLVTAAWLLRPRALGYLVRPSATGVFSGLAALAIQNLVDLSSEVPGVMIAAVMGAACLWGQNAAHPERDANRPPGVVFAVLFGTASAALIAAAWTLGSQTVTKDRDDAVIDFPATPTDADAYANYRAELRGAMHRHPAEPYFPRNGALLAWRGHRETPLPWLELALERAPTSGRTNYLLGVYLAQRGFGQQALMELRMATGYAPGLAQYVTSVALLVTHDPTALRRVVPDGKNGAPVLYALAIKLPDELAGTRDAFLEEASGRDPEYVNSRRVLAERLLAPLESPDASGRCVGAERIRCARLISAQCDALDRLLPDSEDPVVLRARLFMAVGQARVAARNLALQCRKFADRLNCDRTWLEAAARAQDTDMAAQAAGELVLNGCAGQHRCANTYVFIADTFMKAGDAVRALGYFERAAREDPLPSRWHRVADVATEIGDALLAKGDTAGAIAYCERAANEDPSVARWRRVASLKQPTAPPPPPTIGLSHGPELPQDARDAISHAQIVTARPLRR